MKKNIWIISQSNSHILTQIISDNLLMLGLTDGLNIIDNIDDISSLDNFLNNFNEENDPTIYYIFEDKKLAEHTRDFCQNNGIISLDVHLLAFSYFNRTLTAKINHKNKSFVLDRVNSDFLDFAISADDGKKPNSLLTADLVIIGISRTTKTPLSMYLSNLGYKVANLPLLPEVDPPRELFQVDHEKIFALEMDPQRLLSIRSERLKSLGLAKNSIYASLERIKEEMEYAKGIFQKVGCRTIDVSYLSIEETADVIINTIKKV